MSKKEVRLIFNLDNERDKKIYEAVSNKSVATAYIKDILIDYMSGVLVDKNTYNSIIEQITKGINLFELEENTNTVGVTIDINDNIEDLNEFED